MTIFTLRPVDPVMDAPKLHQWVTHPRGHFWQMADCDVEQVQQAYGVIREYPSHNAFLGLVDSDPAFLVERYDPTGDPVGRAHDEQPGDIGMHVLVAPTDTPMPGFTREVFATTTLDLRAAHFDLSCLNRLQLRNNQQMVDLADGVGALAFASRITNPPAHAHS